MCILSVELGQRIAALDRGFVCGLVASTDKAGALTDSAGSRGGDSRPEMQIAVTGRSDGGDAGQEPNPIISGTCAI